MFQNDTALVPSLVITAILSVVIFIWLVYESGDRRRFEDRVRVFFKRFFNSWRRTKDVHPNEVQGAHG
jgi:hypothetical protein